MHLSLNTREQGLLAEALRVLASPFEHDTAEQWLGEVVTHTRQILGGALCWFQLPQEHGVLAVGLPISDEDLARYREFESLQRETGYFERSAGVRVGTRRTTYGPYYEEVSQSAYVQEYLRSLGVGESLSLCVPLCTRPRRQRDIAQLLLNVEYGEAPYSEQAVQRAQLLYPAITAGVASYRRLAALRNRMSPLLDAGGGACAVFSPDGSLLHGTPALERALTREPRRDELMTRIREVAICFGSRDAERRQHAVSNAPFVGVCGPYTLAPTWVRGLARLPSILVTVTPPPARPSLPSAETLRDRFGLTPQEARVALQLAERRTNQEIADALCISVHTARHHVRQALEKLGVPRRTVKEMLLGRSDANART